MFVLNKNKTILMRKIHVSSKIGQYFDMYLEFWYKTEVHGRFYKITVINVIKSLGLGCALQNFTGNKSIMFVNCTERSF